MPNSQAGKVILICTIATVIFTVIYGIAWSFEQTRLFVSPDLEEGMSYAAAVMIQLSPTVLWTMAKKMDGDASDVAYFSGWIFTVIDGATNVGAYLSSQTSFTFFSTGTIRQVLMVGFCVLITQAEESVAWLASLLFDTIYEFQRARGRRAPKWMLWASELAQAGVPSRNEGSSRVEEIMAAQRRKEAESSKNSHHAPVMTRDK